MDELAAATDSVTSEEEVLKTISILEAKEQEYYAEHTARVIAMQLGIGDVRAAGLHQERQVQGQAFRDLIRLEKLKLQKIRDEARPASQRPDRLSTSHIKMVDRVAKLARGDSQSRHGTLMINPTPPDIYDHHSYKFTVHPDGTETWDKFSKRMEDRILMFKLDRETEWITEEEFNRPNVPFAMRVEQEVKQRIHAAMVARHAKEKLDAEEAIRTAALERKRIEAERLEKAVQLYMANM